MGEDRRQFSDASAFLNRQASSMTLIEACIVLVVVAVLIVFAVLAVLRAREENNKKICQENLHQIGKALYAYSMSGYEFYPFSWGAAGEKQPRNKDAMTSIGLLYPEYLGTADFFRCPSTKDRPWFRTNVPFPVKDRNGDGEIDDNDVLASEYYVWSNRNFTLVDSSYGYDCRVHPSVKPKHVIAAEMERSHSASQARNAGNPGKGYHVLCADGSTKLQNNNYCSNNPDDNIFAEDAWHADTDSFISDNTPPGSDNTPGAFNDLSVSYDGYKDLRPR